MDSFTELTDQSRRAMQSVVQIHAQGYNSENLRSVLDPRYVEPIEWTGSGFFIKLNGEEGYILTNAHVVRNSRKLQVMSLLTSEEMFSVDVVGLVTCLEPDVALLKMPAEEVQRFKSISGGTLPTLDYDDTIPERGNSVTAIGYPLGMVEPNVSGGQISNFISGDSEIPERLVTDAAINPGNSGGPSISSEGKVIGLNTAIIEDANNIGFITPIRYAKLLIPTLIETGNAELAHPGASFQSNSVHNAEALGTNDASGVIVSQVRSGGMFDCAGIQRLDIIRAIEGSEFDRHGIVCGQDQYRKFNIYDVIRNLPLGAEVTLHYYHNQKERTTRATAMSHPLRPVPSQPLVGQRRYIEFEGMIIQELSQEIVIALSQYGYQNYIGFLEPEAYSKACTVVTDVALGSLAHRIGFEIGEIITAIGDDSATSPISTLEQLQKAFENHSEQKPIRIETRSGAFGAFPHSSLKIATALSQPGSSNEQPNPYH